MSNRQNEQDIAALAANLEATCGPCAEFSDHKPGEWILYRIAGEIKRGLILHVVPPQQLQSQHIPLTYLCHSGASGDGWPDYVYVTDVIYEELSD